MKNIISFITLLLFVPSISNYVFSTEAKEGLLLPVLDVDGEELQSDSEYYVQSVIRPGGGLFPYHLPNKTCTRAVAQLPLFGDGSPVIFSPVNSKKGDVILQSTDLNIMFPPVHGCDNRWKLEYDDSAKRNFVVTSGLPGNGTISTWFQIESVNSGSASNFYKFVYCPKVLLICTDVVIYGYDGVRRLALDESNFPSSRFLFRKVQTVNTH